MVVCTTVRLRNRATLRARAISPVYELGEPLWRRERREARGARGVEEDVEEADVARDRLEELPACV
eukprot:3954515-Pleurochrysis_carterae.AAC.1